jgi:phage-related minor tail protein
MSDDLNPEIKISADASGVEAGVSKAKRSLADLGVAAVRTGKAAGDGLASIGAGAEKSSRQVDKAARDSEIATRRLASEIQRLTALQESGGAKNAQFFENRARQLGADMNALAPALEKMRALETAQKSAAAGFDKVGISAKQTAAALRGVPAQFTDIVTSIASGQAPLTVLLQQGGQLKDMFGGAGNAARALGGYILGLVNPYTVLAGLVGATAVAYYKGSQESAEFAKSIILSGNAAGVTTSQLQTYAQSISKVAGTQSKAAEALAEFVTTGKVGRDGLEAFTRAAIRRVG